MKKLATAFLIFVMTFSVTACGGNGDTDSSSEDANVQSEISSEDTSDSEDASKIEEVSDKTDSDESSKDDSSASETGSHILVAYFSRVGNTEWEDDVDAVTSASINVENGKFVGNAEYLAKMTQAATGGDLFLIQTEETYPSDYRETTDVAADEQDEDARPALASHVENMDSYNTIVLIYPNWWGTLPQPLFTFLEEYDFSGKTILPLCTHGGSRMGGSESDIRNLCPDATLLVGLAVSGSDAASAQSEVEEWINNSGILR